MKTRRKLIEPGTRFGSWTVRDNTVVNRFRMHQVVAECDCGKFAVVIAANLRERKTTGCSSCSSSADGSRYPDRLHCEEVQEIRRRLRDGETANALGQEFKVTRGHIHQIDRGLLWHSLPWPAGIGPRTGAAKLKLSRTDVEDIRTRIALGEKQSDLAVQYGVSYKHISGVWRGECYVWVPWPLGRQKAKR